MLANFSWETTKRYSWDYLKLCWGTSNCRTGGKQQSFVFPSERIQKIPSTPPGRIQGCDPVTATEYVGSAQPQSSSHSQAQPLGMPNMWPGRLWEELKPWGGRDSINTFCVPRPLSLEYFMHPLWLMLACREKSLCRWRAFGCSVSGAPSRCSRSRQVRQRAPFASVCHTPAQEESYLGLTRVRLRPL